VELPASGAAQACLSLAALNSLIGRITSSCPFVTTGRGR
jgi:hypothetical protein